MVARRDLGIRDAADAATDAEGELEVARQVHGVYALLESTRATPTQRIQRTGGYLGMPTARVRRYLSLHFAPADIREMFLEGRLSARAVEILQGLKPENQRIVARQVIAEASTTSLNASGHAVDQCATRGWTADARGFEKRLQDACALLNTYLDAPRGRLINTFTGAGGAVGRRSLIELIDRQMSLLETLKETLERVDGVAEEKGPSAHEATAAADSR
jgi:hypothetical protein